MLASKSTLVHAKLSQYLYVIVTLYPFEGVLEKNAQYIDSYIQQCVGDANSEARFIGRKSFFAWKKLAPENADNLFISFDYQSQKAITEEQDNYDIDNFDAHIGLGDSKEKVYNDDILKKINSLMISNINSTQNNSTVSFSYFY